MSDWSGDDGRPALRRTLRRLARLFCVSLALGFVLGALYSTTGGVRPTRPAATTVSTENASTVSVRLATLQRPASALLMLALLDAQRVRAGRPALRLDPRLSTIARARSRDMIARHYFAHAIPGGGTVFTLLDRAHVPYGLAGENLALNNYAYFMPPAAVLRRTIHDFMASRDHRWNLLDPGFTHIGVGLAGDRQTGRTIVTMVFVGP